MLSKLPSPFSFIYTLLLVAHVFGCSKATEQSSSALKEVDILPGQIRKSPNDTNQYRYLELPNELKVVLIYDQDSEKSAASLSVSRGSFHEPDEFPGLAHFVEHMLFIGTETYPEVDSFQNFVSSNGGSTNAYTANDHTNYFFDISSVEIKEGLSRFAHFFIDPLFAEGYVNREKNAVHSEYQMQYKDDGWRGYMVSKIAMNPAHPGSRFSIGSLETLGEGIHEALVDFFNTHYSADQMNLVVYSNMDLDSGEKLVRSLFGQIRNINAGSIYPEEPLFTDEQLPAKLISKSIKDINQLSLTFPVPSLTEHYQSKPDRYITNILGHEGPGSLHAYLNEKGWIESLGAGSQSFDKNTSLIVINIAMTNQGAGKTDQIIGAVFQYIDFLREQPLSESLYDEQASLADLEFQFVESASPMGVVYSLAPKLSETIVEDLLIAPYLMKEFQPKKIKEYLDLLTQKNVLVEINSKTAKTTDTEQWFEVPYKLQLGEITISRVEDFTPLLPTTNPFIPEELALVPRDQVTMERRHNDAELEIWYDADSEFGAPRSVMSAEIQIKGGIASPQDQVIADLYVGLVKDSLKKEVYPAYLAGLSYDLRAVDAGIQILIEGFEDKQLLLFRLVLERFLSLKIDDAKLTTEKESFKKNVSNLALNKPYQQALNTLQELLISTKHGPNKLLANIDNINKTALLKWRERVLTGVSIRAGIHGNVTDSDLTKFKNYLEETLPLLAVNRFKPDLLEVDKIYDHKMKIEHDDSSLLLYVQGGGNTLYDRALTSLTGQILGSPFFTELRTKQQLGYVVNAGSRRFKKTPGLVFLVQSPVSGADDVEKSIKEFLKSFKDTWSKYPEAEFERQKKGLITLLTEREKNLKERSQRFWADIEDEHYSLDSQVLIAKETEKISKEEVLSLLKKVISDVSDQRIKIFSQGKFPQKS